MSEIYLYGEPGAESLYRDMEGVIKAANDDNPNRVYVIEQWTSHPPLSHLVKAAVLVEGIINDLADAEIDEVCYEDWVRASEQPDVVAAFQAAFELMASKVVYRMADELVGTYSVVGNEVGEILSISETVDES